MTTTVKTVVMTSANITYNKQEKDELGESYHRFVSEFSITFTFKSMLTHAPP